MDYFEKKNNERIRKRSELLIIGVQFIGLFGALIVFNWCIAAGLQEYLNPPFLFNCFTIIMF